MELTKEKLQKLIKEELIKEIGDRKEYIEIEQFISRIKSKIFKVSFITVNIFGLNNISFNEPDLKIHSKDISVFTSKASFSLSRRNIDYIEFLPMRQTYKIFLSKNMGVINIKTYQ